MAQGYYLSGRHKMPASFDYFFRSLPFEGGYVICAGLADLIRLIEDFRFEKEDLQYLREQGFRDAFLEYLSGFRFSGDLYSVKEGEVVFPGEPVIRVEGNIMEAQLLETLLLNVMNFESLIATKASRLKLASEGRPVLDFGLRRSQGMGGNQASRGAFIGGVDATSNVWAAKEYGIPASGTMAHSWIQSFDSEKKAFQTYAEHYPDSTILLVDTYDTLKSGVPNAIEVAKEMEEKGHKLKAIRLDSGDLAYFARKSRKLLDDAGLEYVQIAVSNQLDEYLIKSLLDQEAPIDLFGVGTKLVTAYDDPALDGVYKLSSIDGIPTLKISENPEKITLPDLKKVFRYTDEEGYFYADAVAIREQEQPERIYHPHYPNKTTDLSSKPAEMILSPVLRKGEQVSDLPDASESAAYAKERLQKLRPEHKRFANPHVYKVGITEELMKLRDQLIKEG